jgi:tRNA(Ile)-lysidine synthase
VSHHNHALAIQFERFLQSAELVRPGQSVLLAVSGGIDSMVMLHLFSQLPPAWNLKLAVAHVNHQLRGEESDGDEMFVRNAVASLNLPILCGRVDTVDHAHARHLSKQEAARELRYRFLDQARRQLNMDVLATAHQADDNAETVLLNALRGAGVRGLAGIPLRRAADNIIRPMLFARRREIADFARDCGIVFRLDSSNESIEYRRNYLRHKVIPVLEASGTFEFVPSLNRLARMMRQLDDLLTAEVRQILPGILVQEAQGAMSMNITKLQSKPEYLQEGLVLEVLRRLGAELESEKVQRVLALCDLTTGSQVQLSKDLHVYRNRERLDFIRPREESLLHEAVCLGKSYTFEDFRFSLSLPLPPPTKLGTSKEVEYVDAEKLGSHLFLRTWQDGDWFLPLGMKAKKKLSDYFVDEKVSLLQKKKIPILESDGEIVWVCGKRLDERFKVTEGTHSVIKLEFGNTIFSH